MIISKLDLSNWMTHRHLSLGFSPLTVICGPNESGKSSIADAVAFALMATLRRISAKGDRPLLVTQGAKNGYVSIGCGEGGDAVTYVRDIATGRPKGAGVAIPIGEDAVKEAVAYVLEPSLFARATADERRNLLLAVMRVSLSPEALLKELEERGHSRDLLNYLVPQEPLAKWVAFCDRSASEARGAWKAHTGETYGSAKAEGWTAQDAQAGYDPEELQTLTDQCAVLRSRLDALHKEHGSIDAQSKAATDRAARLTAAQAKATEGQEAAMALARAVANLVTAEDTEKSALDALTKLKALPVRGKDFACPDCGSLLEFVDDKLIHARTDGATAITSQTALLNASAAYKSAQAALTAMRAPVERIRTNIARIEAAKQQIAELTEETMAAPAPPDESTVLANIAAVEAELSPMSDRLAELHGQSGDVRRAQQATAAATNAHAQVKAWVALSDALSPSGLPSEMLAKALGPFNETLARLATETHWEAVSLSADMALSRNGLPYALLSESAQWRADVMLTVALAELSALRFVILDRFDVLELAARKPALVWLYGLTKAKALDTAILLGTLKEPPQTPAAVSVHWLGQPQ